jgi:ABC-type Na+ efflux pump permease subunit
MLAFANAAMLWLGRRPLPWGNGHAVAMFTGGNFGMVLGMFAGGLLAAQIATESVTIAAILGFSGMTAGMIAGMFGGTWLVEWLLGAVSVVPALPHWFRNARAG